MDDTGVLGRIDVLAEEEHQLREKASSGDGLDDEERARLQSLELSLDQCWDLLRQRRARRRAGLDPDEADARDTETVEHYEQ